jgi:TolB-like protein
LTPRGGEPRRARRISSLPLALALALAPAAAAAFPVPIPPSRPAPASAPPSAPVPMVPGPPPAAPPPAARPMPVPLPTLPARSRVAIQEFQVEGEAASDVLGLQLQEGFMIGLVRAGIPVLDSTEVARRKKESPELEKCDSSLCLKRLGQLLEVRHLLRVRVNVSGNSYRMTARLFSTEGASPAVLPTETQSRFCDVCTVAEAREMMIRLADAIRGPIEAPIVVVPLPPPPPPPKPSRRPLAGLAAGLVALAAGATILFVADEGKPLSAVGGGLMGAGLTVSAISVYLMAVDPGRERPGLVVTASRSF